MFVELTWIISPHDNIKLELQYCQFLIKLDILFSIKLSIYLRTKNVEGVLNLITKWSI